MRFLLDIAGWAGNSPELSSKTPRHNTEGTERALYLHRDPVDRLLMVQATNGNLPSFPAMPHFTHVVPRRSGKPCSFGGGGQRGFSLIELAVVFVVVALVLGGLLIPLTTQFEQQRIRETQKAMDEIKEALIGYALSHAAVDGKPYLPCPDTDGDGLEDARGAGGDCMSLEGRVPRATLGTARADGWGRQFRYRVEQAFSNNQNGFSLTTMGNLQVCASSASCSTTVVANNLPVVIVSHGKNGFGARDDQSNVIGVSADVHADELENLNGRNNPTAGNNSPDTADSAVASRLNFVSRVQAEAGTAAGEFDDLVTWLSPNILFNRMVAAGRLP